MEFEDFGGFGGECRNHCNEHYTEERIAIIKERLQRY